MNKKQLDALDKGRVYPQCIHVTSLKNGSYIVFEGGCGDNLFKEDIEEGYVDYVNYTRYDLMFDGELHATEWDGGMVLLKKPYLEIPIDELLEYILEEVTYPEACPDIETADVSIVDMFIE